MRLIDADKFILALMDAALSSIDEDTILDLIDSVPTVDAVPVVRCKDCKHYRTYMGRDMCAKNVKLLGWREVGLCATGKDDFCNYGERKNDER